MTGGYDTRGLSFETSLTNSTKYRLTRATPRFHKSPTSTLLFVAILSHWKRWRRRDSIRETWMTHCRHNSTVKCLFFTDDVGTGEQEKHLLETEIKENNDTILMPIVGKQFLIIWFTST